MKNEKENKACALEMNNLIYDLQERDIQTMQFAIMEFSLSLHSHFEL